MLLLDREDLEGRSKLHGALEEVAKQSLRAGEIIRHLREFVTTGETGKQLEDVRELVEEAAALALVGSRGVGVRTTFDFAPNTGPVLVDRIQIQQVLTNLIRNAIEAMSETPNKLLSITARRVDGLVAVTVADSGHGIAPEIANSVFQPFVSSKATGMGVGLSISRRIITAHGGEISFTSTPSVGTTFTFTLPIFRGSDDESG